MKALWTDFLVSLQLLFTVSGAEAWGDFSGIHFYKIIYIDQP